MNLQFEYGHGLMAAALPDDTGYLALKAAGQA